MLVPDVARARPNPARRRRTAARRRQRTRATATRYSHKHGQCLRAALHAEGVLPPEIKTEYVIITVPVAKHEQPHRDEGAVRDGFRYPDEPRPGDHAPRAASAAGVESVDHAVPPADVADEGVDEPVKAFGNLKDNLAKSLRKLEECKQRHQQLTSQLDQVVAALCPHAWPDANAVTAVPTGGPVFAVSPADVFAPPVSEGSLFVFGGRRVVQPDTFPGTTVGEDIYDSSEFGSVASSDADDPRYQMWRYCGQGMKELDADHTMDQHCIDKLRLLYRSGLEFLRENRKLRTSCAQERSVIADVYDDLAMQANSIMEIHETYAVNGDDESHGSDDSFTRQASSQHSVRFASDAEVLTYEAPPEDSVAAFGRRRRGPSVPTSMTTNTVHEESEQGDIHECRFGGEPHGGACSPIWCGAK